MTAPHDETILPAVGELVQHGTSRREASVQFTVNQDMVLVDLAQREIIFKIVYYGPALSGKTTNMQIVHDRTPCKGKLTCLAAEGDRTLFFDFLPLDLGSVGGMRIKFQLYTVPGQVFCNATRKLVLRGVDGVIFVADSSADKMEENTESVDNLIANLKEHGIDIADIPLVFQYNKRDLPDAVSVKELHDNLNRWNVPALPAVAIRGEGVLDTLECISGLILERVIWKVGRPAAPAGPEPFVSAGGEKGAIPPAREAQKNLKRQDPPSMTAIPPAREAQFDATVPDDLFGPPDLSALAKHHPAGRRGGTTLATYPTPTNRGKYRLLERLRRDKVDCTVFAPPETKLGDALMVQVFAHLPSQAKKAKATAKEFNGDAKERGVTSLGTRIRRGSGLAFELVIPPLVVDEATKVLFWEGKLASVQFAVNIPRDLSPQTVIGTVFISQDTVPVGQVSFKLRILDRTARASTTSAPTGQARRYQQAFISYAREDLRKVLDRVPMLTAAGITYHQDIFDLLPGDEWLPRISRWIDESDAFFLFWSTNAKNSEWVRKEWQHALKREEKDFIRPIIIEGPPIPEPPAELAHLHFGDRASYLRVSPQ